MIKFDSVSVKKEGRVILRDLSLCLDQKRIGIIGHNGSGKSTFIRLINGIEMPATGQVSVNDLYTDKNRKEVLKRVGFVFQNPENQIIYPMVREDLAFGLKNRRLSKSEISDRIQQTAEMFGVSDLLDRLSHTLSGGEKQLVAILSILIMDPDHIVLDEPTTLLDLQNKKKIMDILDNLNQQILVVSHDLEFLKSYDHILRFEQGQLIDQGKPDDVITKYIEDALC
ncbi:energy-coupling factor ABC transporter ATP-binding protein [Curvivirga sp.]|uniref:energy-coupling factor ABC transporter ATP-binding protein n=1 Tax=Curvivirga sp. TaxID=2856848 RepID=UPI003B5B0FCE